MLLLLQRHLQLILKTPLPFLSPKRREALILAPLPYKGRGWGLGLRESCTQSYYSISEICSFFKRRGKR
ncbi:MAG: hypothetical protein ACYT04_000000100115, partial [Nostoc sp.]